MDNSDMVKQIALWVMNHAERESIFLTPHPSWKVDAHALLDHIVSISGVTQDQVSAWLNEGAPGLNINNDTVKGT